MTCKSCNTQLAAGAVFCAKCGTKTDSPQNVPPQQMHHSAQLPQSGQMTGGMDFFMINYAKYFPNEKSNDIRTAISQLTPEENNILNQLPSTLKNPTIIWVFSFFLGQFSVDRFLIKSVKPTIKPFGLGIVKVGTLALAWVSVLLTLSFNPLYWILMVANTVSWFVDLFFIKNATRAYNFEKLSAAFPRLNIQ